MRSIKTLLKVGASLLSFQLLGCQLNPPDVEICQELIGGSAYCDYTISDRPRNVFPDDREVERVGQFCMSPEALNEYQTFVLRACELTQSCTKDLNNLQNGIFRFNNKFHNYSTKETNNVATGE